MSLVPLRLAAPALLLALIAPLGVAAAQTGAGGASAASSPAGAASASISTVHWIAGCWELRAGARVVQEHWMPPLGGAMLAVNRTVARDTIRDWEFLSIVERDGKLVYTARPARQAETSFTAESVTDTSVAFANPAHDFPQRILYRRLGNDSLIARIEGPRGGQMRGIDFPMRRIPCGSTP